jgi:uncharacterized protein YjbI with pentapeptide repeats
MANEEHVALLRQGVETWNAWRKENPDIEPDLSGANLFAANLINAVLPRANLRGTDLSGTDLRGALMYRADLREANLFAANLDKANLTEAVLPKANLNKANLRWANLHGANLDKASLGEADLFSANLDKADLRGADLRSALMYKADLRGALLNGADFRGALLNGADLRGANLGEASLGEANLYRAKLDEASLCDANLYRANLRDASLRGANLRGALLSKASLRRVSLFETVFGNSDLTEVEGLDECRHHGPSTLDHRTIQKSGRLPLSFLRGVGLPDNLIDYLPSLLTQPIQFYSCFISFSSRDQKFADRLHADLQNKGVRCWFAPHDMPIGAKILDTVTEAIRLRDKVLLILSRHSIESEWVETEVTRAFSEERTRKQTVLFPIRIDNTVKRSSEPWAAQLWDSRHIGDFTCWKDPDAYQVALDRLLKDLKVKQDGR